MTTRVTPYIAVKGAAEAIEFYKQAFGATEPGARITEPDGRIGHAELVFGDSHIYLADEYPEIDALGPESLGGAGVRFVLNVDDADALWEQAVAAGATAVRPLEDQFYGERSGMLADPFGHRWMVSMTLEEVSPEEMQERVGDRYKIT